MILYYDSLLMEAKSVFIRKHYIRIVSNQGLDSLQRILGAGVGLGMTKSKPTKKYLIVNCSIGSSITSLELENEIPQHFYHNPLSPYTGNLIDFIYSEPSYVANLRHTHFKYSLIFFLSCFVHHTKLVITDAEVVQSRLCKARVLEQPISGAYVNATFLYNNDLFIVMSIDFDLATCR